MKSFFLFMLVCLHVSCISSSEEQLEEDLEELIQEVDAVGGLDVVGNLQGEEDRQETEQLSTLKRSLVNSGDYGVVIDIQNYSGLKLTDPTLYLDYGKGKGFGEVTGHVIEPTQRDAFVIHDKLGEGSVWSSTSGVISWLIVKPDGSHFEDKSDHRKPLYRLWLYWDTCWDGKNHVTVGFYRNHHDMSKSLPSSGYDTYYELAQRSKNHGLSVQKYKEMIGVARIEPRHCTKEVVLTLQIGSKRHRSNKVETQMDIIEDSLKEIKLIGKEVSVWSYFLIGLGFLAVIVVICILFTKIKGRMQRSSNRSYVPVNQTQDKEDLFTSDKEGIEKVKEITDKEDV